MDPIAAVGSHRPAASMRMPTYTRISPVAAVTSTPTAGEDTSAKSSTDDRAAAREMARQVQIDWHAASRSYVHRVIDVHTGEQILQMPAAQVLDLVADVMRELREA